MTPQEQTINKKYNSQKVRKVLINRRHTMDYEERLTYAKQVITLGLLTNKNPRIAISGGIDSAVMLHMIRQIQPVRAVWINTGIEYPETRSYMKHIQDLDIINPERTYWDIVNEFGFPEESRKNKQPACCRWLKEYPMRDYCKENDVDCVFTGLIASEGQHRRYNYILRGANYFHKSWNLAKATPLILFRKKEIWQYQSENQIPVNPAYEKYNLERIGCKACTGFKGWQAQMEKIDPKLLNLIRNWPTYQPGGGLPK